MSYKFLKNYKGKKMLLIVEYPLVMPDQCSKKFIFKFVLV